MNGCGYTGLVSHYCIFSCFSSWVPRATVSDCLGPPESKWEETPESTFSDKLLGNPRSAEPDFKVKESREAPGKSVRSGVSVKGNDPSLRDPPSH